ncbi:MAG: hypothetical protein ACLRFH_00340 [Opitutales bacterium]
MKKMSIFIVFVCTVFFNNVIAATGWLFKTEEEAKQAFPNSVIKSIIIADPSYDQTFKKILSTSESSKSCLISFLNSLYYPDATKANDFKIQEVDALEKDNVRLGATSSLGMKICDVVCRCTCYRNLATDEDEEKSRKRTKEERDECSFDIEMQRSCDVNILTRAVDYSIELKRKYVNDKIKVLVLWNYVGNGHERIIGSYGFGKKDRRTGNFIEEVKEEDDMPIEIIDLREYKQINLDEKYINRKLIQDLGITWLRLFAIRQWHKSSDGRFKVFYPVNLLHEDVKKALNILEKIDEETLKEAIRQEKQQEGIQTGAIQNALIDNAINFIKTLTITLKQVVEVSKFSEEMTEELILGLKREEYDLESLKQQIDELDFSDNWKAKIKAKL